MPLVVMFQPGIGHCSTRYVRPRAFASRRAVWNTSSNIDEVGVHLKFRCCATDETADRISASNTAASNTRSMNSCFLRRAAVFATSMLSK